MRVQIAKEVFIEAEVPVGIDEITESLQYELNHAQTVNEFEGSSEHSKTFVVQQLLNSAYQCVAAINDEMIDRVSIENRELISVKLSEQVDRWKMTSKCEWTYDDSDCYYKTTCEQAFSFIEDGVNENKFQFCPYCGNRVVEVEFA